MVVLSKLKLIESYRAQCCNDLIHPNGCFGNALRNLYRFTITNSKYFAAIFMIQALLTIKKLDWEKLFDIFKYYMESVQCGILTGWSYSVTICMLRHVLNQFNPYTISIIPVFIGGMASICSATPRVRRLYYTSTIQCAIESLIFRRSNIFTKLMVDSLPVKTLIFMCCSALIMHAKSQQKLRAFWFLQPDALRKRESVSPSSSSSSLKGCCVHKEPTCNSYLVKGLRKYVGLGLTLDIAKSLINQVPAEAVGFFGKASSKMASFRLTSTAFLASYIGIYRFTLCCLNRKTYYSRKLNHILAAFFAGASYMVCPQLTLQCYAIVVSMEILWKRFATYKTKKPSKFLRLLQSFPSAHLLYLCCLVYLVHNYTWSKNFVNKLAHGFLNGTAGNYPKRISLKLNELA